VEAHKAQKEIKEQYYMPVPSKTITAPIISLDNGGIYLDNGLVQTDGQGNLALTGPKLSLSISSAAVVVTSSTTISTAATISRTAPGGAVTGMILGAGTVNGQIVVVTNENVASTANTITFNATIATSFVANDGTNPQVIKCGTCKAFVWIAALNSGNGAWVALEPFAG
jgi:hypothetical protein